MGMKMDVSQWKRLMQGLKEAALKEAAEELAARMLRSVKEKTPVGKEQGGRLRDGWKVAVRRNGRGGYQVVVTNPVEYAAYVEKGHKKPNGGKVAGRFMLAETAKEMEKLAPKLIEAKLARYLRKLL